MPAPGEVNETAMENRRTVLGYIRDHGPCQTKDIIDATGLPRTTVNHCTFYLRTFDHIKSEGMGGNAHWHFLRGLATPVKEAVNIVRNHRWEAPTPIVSHLPDGVKYTYCPAPKDRFCVELERGKGVISADNPRLAVIFG